MAYAYQGQDEKTAKAYGRRLAISTKQSVMICQSIRGKRVERARTILEEAQTLKNPIRFTRFTEGAAHKSGYGPSKFPVKATGQILKVLNSAEANAQNQGLASDLVVAHAVAHQASRGYRYGRHRGRKEKSTHVEIVLKEISKKDLKPKKVVKEAEQKTQPEAGGKKEKEEVEKKNEKKTESKTEAKEDKTEKESKKDTKEIPSRSTVESMTKDEIEAYAKKEFNIELSTNDLKKKMIDKLFEEIKNDR